MAQESGSVRRGRTHPRRAGAARGRREARPRQDAPCCQRGRRRACIRSWCGCIHPPPRRADRAATAAVAPERLTAKARRRIAEHQQYLAQYEPGLQLTVDEVTGEARVRGRIMVLVGAGITRPFEIELVYHGLNPFATPDTYDRAGRFPPSLERHV